MEDKRMEYFNKQVELLKEKLSIGVIRDGKTLIFYDTVTLKVLEVKYPEWTDKTFIYANTKLTEIYKGEIK